MTIIVVCVYWLHIFRKGIAKKADIFFEIPQFYWYIVRGSFLKNKVGIIFFVKDTCKGIL